MPANKNAETRYKILDQLLANRYHHYSTGDLLELVNEELVEMSLKPIKRRSIEYDLNYLENGPFQADIEHYQIDEVSRNNPDKAVKKNCHRYRDRSFSIYQQKMSDDEKHILGEAMKILGQFDGLPNLDRLESLRAGLNIKTDRQIISFTKNPLEDSTRFGELFTAISQKQVIELHYHTFADPDKERQVVLYPYLLREYNRRWYLVAAAEDTGRLLNFRLDQIDNFIALSSHRYIPYKGDLNERFDDIIGVSLYEDRPVQTILFWVSDYSKGYVETKPLHDSQRHYSRENEAELRKQYPMFEGGAFFSINCIENYELIRELTSFGKDLIVLSPNDIQKKVADRVTEMYKEYQIVRK